MTIENETDRPAAILRDREGNIVATGSYATDGVVIAQAERLSLDQAQKRTDAKAAQKYADKYEAGQS